MEYFPLTISPTSARDCKLEWKYDEEYLDCECSNSGVIITAKKEGETLLQVSEKREGTFTGIGVTTVSKIIISGYDNNYIEETTAPYIYSNSSIIQSSPGVSEKVFVSLYGGTVADIDGFTWTVDNPSVCQIQPMGQYCTIKALSSGYARIKVTHTKSEYPYYIGFYVFDDLTKIAYITTSNNVVNLSNKQSTEVISVNLVNSSGNSSDKNFNWSFVDINENEAPVKIIPNGNKITIEPIKESGSCSIRVTHPEASYPLDIYCRVVNKIKNIYISTDSNVINIHGSETKTILSSLINSDNYSLNEFSYKIANEEVAEIEGYVDNQVIIKGKKNGNTKLLISHSEAPYEKEVLILVDRQIVDAVDSSCYITTSQNYVRTKEGDSPIELKILLRGGEPGDEKEFQWAIKSDANDGSTDDVIRLETTNGKAIYENSREAAFTYEEGTAFVYGVKAGTAVISVSHPKIVYPTDILIKVLDKDAIIEEPSYFSGNGFISLLNGNTKEYTINLIGNKNNTGSYSWEYNGKCSIISNENKALITAPAIGTGTTISELIIRHPKVAEEKKVIVLTADTEEELNNAKILYSDKLYYNLVVGDEEYIQCNYQGFDNYNEDGEFIEYDFSPFTWKIQNPEIITIEKNENFPFSCKVKALKAGKTTLTGTIDNCTCTFTIIVYPQNAIQLEKEVYFSTYQNVVHIGSIDETKRVQVDAINLDETEYQNITWENTDESICEVIPNGISATIISKKEGETCLTVKHPKSQNELKIYVRVGSEYIIPATKPVVYISAPEVITLLKDDSPQKLQAVLVNCEDKNPDGFTFSIDNANIADFSAKAGNGIAFIKPLESGQAEIEISNPKAEMTKKVLVLVGNSAEELAGITYLTTSNNVVSLGEGSTKTVSVSVKNAESTVFDGFVWESSNRNVIDVQAVGATAVLKGNSIGTAIITVKHPSCQYNLEIIAQCVDPIAASSSPYIQVSSSVILMNTNSTYQKITAELIGGSDEDQHDFQWESNDATILSVYGQNGVANCKAQKAGQTYITVSHPKAAYSAQILVVCDDVKESDCYISVPSSIITMKPNESSKTINASLINGTETDKYNFSWTQDVYDVVDLQYSANVATIIPKQAGTATITVSHPKAAYDQQIIVNVQQYDKFGFPNTNISVTQGDVKFLQMQIPTTSVTTHIEYEVENEKICSISGTKSVAQLTAINPGTTNVKAKLVASGTGIVQAETEMLIYVKEKPTNTVFLLSSQTIQTVQKDKSTTLSASLSGDGITSTDINNITWSTKDTDVIKITGLNTDGTVKGKSVYITALKPGEALITATHEKADSNLQFFIVVPGGEEKLISLNKTFMTMTKGTSGMQLRATIDNSDGNIDYENLIWEAKKIEGAADNPVRIMGSGQTVTIFPVDVGEVEVTAKLEGTQSIGKCQVIVEPVRSLTLGITSKKLAPLSTTIIDYEVSPPEAIITWTAVQNDDYFTVTDLGRDKNNKAKGQIQVSGIKAGTGSIVGLTDGNAKANMAVSVSWDYSFSLSGSTSFTIKPTESKEITYSVNPPNCNISLESSLANTYFSYTITSSGNDTGTGKIKITPLKEYKNSDITITVKATNPADNNKVAGTGTIKARFSYDSLTPTISFEQSVGNFSTYDTNNKQLVIGDGESIILSLGIAEEKADGSIEKVEFIPTSGLLNQTNYTEGLTVSGISNGKVTVTNKLADQIEQEYLITKAYVPTYNGSVIPNWQQDVVWYAETDAYSYKSGGFLSLGSKETTWRSNYFGLVSKTYSNYGLKGGSGLNWTYTVYDWIYDPGLYYGLTDAKRIYENTLKGLSETDSNGITISEEQAKSDYDYYVIQNAKNYCRRSGPGMDITGGDHTWWDDYEKKSERKALKVEEMKLMTGEACKFLITYSDEWSGANYGSAFSKVLDSSYTNTRMSIEKFQSIPWFYCPGTPAIDNSMNVTKYIDLSNGSTNSTGDDFGGLKVAKGIMTENVTASIVNSNNKKETKKYLGTLKITIKHANKSEVSPIQISVYQAVRQCPCTQE